MEIQMYVAMFISEFDVTLEENVVPEPVSSQNKKNFYVPGLKAYMSSWKNSKEGDPPLCSLPKREILHKTIPRH